MDYTVQEESRLTAEELGVHGLWGLEEGVGQEGPVVGIHLMAVLVYFRTAGQIGPKGGQRHELHQLYIRDVAEAAVVGVSTADLER